MIKQYVKKYNIVCIRFSSNEDLAKYISSFGEFCN